MRNSAVPLPAPLEVAIVALWKRRQGGIEVLVTRRPVGVHLAGRWELPGGKLRESETSAAAAAREIAEETGIRIDPCGLTPLTPVLHAYPDRIVRLIPFLLEISADSQVDSALAVDYRWMKLADFEDVDFPAANRSITHEISQALRALDVSTIPEGPPECNIRRHKR